MRVLYIPSGDDKYGAPKSLMELVKNLRDNYGIEPIILTCSHSMINEWCDNEGIESYVLGQGAFMVVGGSNPFRKIVKHAMYPFLRYQYLKDNRIAQAKIEEILKDKKIDLVHTNVNRIDIGGIYALKHNIPHIWHLREFGKEDYNCMYLRNDAIEFMNNSTTRFIAISNAVKKRWVEKGLEENKIEVVYNGIDLGRFPNEYPNTKNSAGKKMRIVFAGIVSETKGQIYLIEAVRKIPIEQRRRIDVDIWGGGRTAYINYLINLTKKYHLEDVIHFRGYTQKLPEILPSYDIGIVGSRAEAFGRVTAEYMAAGLFVIASDTGANPEIVNHGITGIIYKYADASSLKDSIIFAINNSEKMNQIRRNAYYEARKKYTMERCATDVYCVYKKALGELV